MKELRKKAALFFNRNRNRGIPNLMLYVAIGNLVVFVLDMIDPSGALVQMLAFDPQAVLRGQIWRIFTVAFLDVTYQSSLLAAIFVFAYYWFGKIVEQWWGTLKLNIYYFGGLLLMAAAGLITNSVYSAYILNRTMFLLFAIVMPEAQIRLWGILPLKAKYLAWFELIEALWASVSNLRLLRYGTGGVIFYVIAPILPIVYCLLFAGKDWVYLLPDFLTQKRTKTQTEFRRFQNEERAKTRQRPNPNWAKSYQSPTGEKPYRHKCTVCGRTDVTNPELDFRYCSKCNGYYCYCMEHINNHVHIQ